MTSKTAKNIQGIDAARLNDGSEFDLRRRSHHRCTCAEYDSRFHTTAIAKAPTVRCAGHFGDVCLEEVLDVRQDADEEHGE
jgi:hypothetical protein